MMEHAQLSTGAPAPGFTLKDLSGANHSLVDALGRILIINFWSAECPWSERVDRDFQPYIAAWAERVLYYPIATNANEPEDLLREVSASRGLPLVLLDPQQVVADLYGAITTPHFFVVDEKGILRYQGAFDDVTFRQRKPTRQYLIPAVQALLSGQNPDPTEVPSYGCTIVRSFES